MRNLVLFDTKRYRRMITDCKARVSEFYDWYDNNIRTEGIDGENIEESEVPEEVIEDTPYQYVISLHKLHAGETCESTFQP